MNRAIRQVGHSMALVMMLLLCSRIALCTLAQMSIDELTEGASYIVLGHVLDVEKQWDEESTAVVTLATIKPDQVLKGVLSDMVMAVQVPAGEDQPVFALGESVLVFLRQGQGERYHVYSSRDGKISLGSPDAERIVSQVRQILHSGDYFPMEIRSRWQFGPGTRKSGYILEPGSIVDRTDSLDGGHFSSYVGYPRNFFKRDGKVYEPSYVGFGPTEWRLWYDFSAPVDSSWTLDREGFTDDDPMNGARITLVSKSDTVTTPFGTFQDCVHFHCASRLMDAGVSDEWFAPNIGCVKRVMDSWVGYVTHLLEHAQITVLPKVRVVDGFVFRETEEGGQEPLEGVEVIGYFGPCWWCIDPYTTFAETDSVGYFSFGDMASSTYADLVFVPARFPDWRNDISRFVEILSETQSIVVIVPRPTNVETAGQDEGILPQTVALSQNYPNPFNAATRISFAIPDYTGKITLAVYNLHGQKVRTLVDGMMDAGVYTVPWDGKDALGRDTASGIYLCRMSTENGSTPTRKMVLMR